MFSTPSRQKKCGGQDSLIRLGRYQNFDFDPIPSTFKPSIESIEYQLSTQLMRVYMNTLVIYQ